MESGLQAWASALGVFLIGFGAVGAVLAVSADWALRKWLGEERGASRDLSRVNPRAAAAELPLPSISVLRPVKGAELGLRENFLALVNQDYPIFEILIGAEDANDPALAIAREVAANSPVPMRVVVCPVHTGLNPKVSILEALAREARHDAVLISDSNVRVVPGYLRNLAVRLNGVGVGLVTNIVLGQSPGTLAAGFEVLQLATFVARGTLFARRYLSHVCVVGKSMLFRRSDWTRLGGFAQVRNVLAEDYVMGQRFSEAGFTIALSPDPIPVPLPRWSWSQLWNRHLRWAQMRRRVSLSVYSIEPLLYPWPIVTAGLGLCWVSAVQFPVFYVGALSLLFKLVSDAWLLRTLQMARVGVWVCLSPIKDFLLLFIWCTGLVKRSLTWRGNRLIVGTGSTLSRADGCGEFAAEIAETLP